MKPVPLWTLGDAIEACPYRSILGIGLTEAQVLSRDRAHRDRTKSLLLALVGNASGGRA